MPRFALSEPSIGSTTTSVEPLPTRPTSSETIVTSSSRKRATIASSAAWSIAVVSSPPRPCADDRLALDARRQLDEHAAARPRRRRGRRRASRSQRQEAAGRTSASDRRTCSSAASRRRGRAISHTSSIRVGRSRNAASASPRSTAATASRACGVYVTPCGASRSTTSGSSPSPSISSYRPCPVEDESRQVIGRLVDRRAADAVDRLRDAVRREDRQPLLVGRDDHDEQPRRRLGAVLLVERERGLVAVVAVGDQQLRVRQLLGERVAEVGVEPPEPRGDAALLGGEVGLAETVERRSSRPRAGRSARAACASHEAGAAAPPSGRRACARAGGRRGSRTARRAARRRSPRGVRATPSGPT